jgi:hypothetical protein
MIMKRQAFRYNSKNTITINALQSTKPYPTPVGRRLGNCHRTVDIFIHSAIHSFSYPIQRGFSTGSYNPRRSAVPSLATP